MGLPACSNCGATEGKDAIDDHAIVCTECYAIERMLNNESLAKVYTLERDTSSWICIFVSIDIKGEPVITIE